MELEADREAYDDKVAKGVEILDSLSNWEQIWRKVDKEKKNHLINLLTFKISTRHRIPTANPELNPSKYLDITYLPEVEELFWAGLIELSNKITPTFNSPKFRDG